MDFAFEAEIIALRRGRDEVRGGEASAEQAGQSKLGRASRGDQAEQMCREGELEHCMT